MFSMKKKRRYQARLFHWSIKEYDISKSVNNTEIFQISVTYSAEDSYALAEVCNCSELARTISHRLK